MTERTNNSIPASWVLAPLSEVAKINPREFDQEPTDTDEVSFVPMASVEAGSGKLDASLSRPWSEVKKGFTRFQENDVLFAKITPCMENAKFALASKLILGRGAGSTEFHVIRAASAIQPRYVLFFLLQEATRRDARLSMKGAAGQLRVPPEFVERLSIPIPPAEEQLRIIAEIEKQFTRLDAAVIALGHVKTNFKRYRAAVLKAACEGRLVTAEAELARREGRPYEHASALLERILQEHRSRWSSTSKYKETVGPDSASLPDLPEGWCWATLGQLYEIKYGLSEPLSKMSPQSPEDIPVIRMANVTESGGLRLDVLKYFSLSSTQRQKLLLQRGDLLFNWRNAPNLVGKTAHFDVEGNYVNASFLLRMRPPNPAFDARFQWVYINNLRWNGYFEIRSNAAVNQSNFNASRTAQIPVPLPPLEEQRRIVAEVERRLSVIDELETQIEANETRSERLRQGILKTAFEGKLVPQDPHDEPANSLLERVRAAREANPISAPRFRGRRKKEATHVS